LPLFTPERRETEWETFVAGVPSCASLAKSGSTFTCLRSTNTTEIFEGILFAMAAAIEQFPWEPVIDGPEGLIPDLPSVLFKRGQFARLPFIAGTSLDEGDMLSLISGFRDFNSILGTLFTDPTVNSSVGISESLVAQYSPSASPRALDKSILTLLKLYPDIPSLG
jgi:carboxylesterase type B